MSETAKQAAMEFKRDMQGLVNSSEEIDKISMSVNGGPEVVIAEKKQLEDNISLRCASGASGKSEEFLPPLHLVCHNDEFRPNMKLIEVKNGIAQATNAHMIVKVNLIEASKLTADQVDMLNGRYVHMEVWKEIHKCEMIELSEDYIVCWKNGIKKIFEYGEPNGEFFSIDTIIRNCKEAGEEPQRLVGMNAKYIEILHKIFGSGTIYFSFSAANHGIICFPGEDSGMFALLVPVTTDGVNRYMFLTD